MTSRVPRVYQVFTTGGSHVHRLGGWRVVLLTVHVPLMLVLYERIAPRLPCPLVVDDVNLEGKKQDVDSGVVQKKQTTTSNIIEKPPVTKSFYSHHEHVKMLKGRHFTYFEFDGSNMEVQRNIFIRRVIWLVEKDALKDAVCEKFNKLNGKTKNLQPIIRKYGRTRLMGP